VERERTALEVELAGNIAYKVEGMLVRLRNTADAIEREMRLLDRAGTRDTPTYATVAGRVLDELRAMNGNLMTSSLVEAAYQADAERIRTS
jgi:hypothetical protein